LLVGDPSELWSPASTTGCHGNTVNVFNGLPEVTGCTCNMLLLVSRWFSRCVLQDKGQEIMDGLKMAIVGKYFN
jgi:hypothetical protein